MEAWYEPIAGGGMQNVWNVTVERDGGDKPVLVAEWLTRSYS